MIFNSTNGQQIAVNLVRAAATRRSLHTSRIQQCTAQFLQDYFGQLDIYEEFYVDNCYFDFFIPAIRLCIEVDGVQHDNFVKFFHKNGNGFKRHIERDERKELFCRLNQLTLIRITEADVSNEQAFLEKIKNGLECS